MKKQKIKSYFCLKTRISLSMSPVRIVILVQAPTWKSKSISLIGKKVFVSRLVLTSTLTLRWSWVLTLKDTNLLSFMHSLFGAFLCLVYPLGAPLAPLLSAALVSTSLVLFVSALNYLGKVPLVRESVKNGPQVFYRPSQPLTNLFFPLTQKMSLSNSQRLPILKNYRQFLMQGSDILWILKLVLSFPLVRVSLSLGFHSKQIIDR
eukprot:Lithocolla_globosa_v1_NODE_131_length_5925_cov_14.179557.p3 type:complete len:206 gc:universal NODE_131_length_5925_cov_14.179557:3572-2955(-)